MRSAAASPAYRTERKMSVGKIHCRKVKDTIVANLAFTLEASNALQVKLAVVSPLLWSLAYVTQCSPGYKSYTWLQCITKQDIKDKSALEAI